MTRPHLKRAGAPLRVRGPHGAPPSLAGALVLPPVQETGDGLFAGYASLFGVPDGEGDVVAPGAFARALAIRGGGRGPGRIAMLWQHDPARPVGAWTHMMEDATGLWVEGRLALESEAGREAHALLKARALTGLSIGFHAVRAARRPGSGGAGGGRTLHEIDLWEVSLVTFPMLDGARVTRIKSAPDPVPASFSGAPFSGAQAEALARVMRRAAATLARPHADRKGETSA